MNKLILPKKYLSYSAIDLWNKNKEQYRKRYYEGEPFVETEETKYGKHVHKMIETHDPSVEKIPRYNLHEVRLEVMIGDVPIVAFVDSMCGYTGRFYDYKTGRPKPDGRPRWDAVEVAKTDQLPFYSLFIKEISKGEGGDDLCHLIWLPTNYVKKTVEFEGHTLSTDSKEVVWNGEVHVFPRVIREYERKAAREKIIRSAHEISEDYVKYLETKKRGENLAPDLGALPSAPAPVVG